MPGRNRSSRAKESSQKSITLWTQVVDLKLTKKYILLVYLRGRGQPLKKKRAF